MSSFTKFKVQTQLNQIKFYINKILYTTYMFCLQPIKV